MQPARRPDGQTRSAASTADSSGDRVPSAKPEMLSADVPHRPLRGHHSPELLPGDRPPRRPGSTLTSQDCHRGAGSLPSLQDRPCRRPFLPGPRIKTPAEKALVWAFQGDRFLNTRFLKVPPDRQSHSASHDITPSPLTPRPSLFIVPSPHWGVGLRSPSRQARRWGQRPAR